MDKSLFKWKNPALEDELSSWKSVRSGMPQGSVRGPTLFVIFINDMPDVVRSMCQLFADDAKIFRSIKSLDDNKVLQGDINKLTEWSGTLAITVQRNQMQEPTYR